jgi:hypothetical protein
MPSERRRESLAQGALDDTHEATELVAVPIMSLPKDNYESISLYPHCYLLIPSLYCLLPVPLLQTS